MKKLICATLLLTFIPVVFAQKTQDKPALQAMVETELAFARMSEEQGTRPAFFTFVADDGILFRPRAVNGKQWMAENPIRPSGDTRNLLSWYPTIAGISRQGDMGYTTGPWAYKDNIKDAKPVAWGHFLTVWKKQADGSWKFAIDLGISNPKPAQAAGRWQLPKNYEATKAKKGRWSFSKEKLLTRDREFSKASSSRGAAAFVSYAAREVQVYRDGKFPFVGQRMAVAALPASTNAWTWEPAFGDVSISDDLGYTYGTYRIESKESTPKIIETGNYFRIWKKQGGIWKVLFDLTNPVPPETKN